MLDISNKTATAYVIGVALGDGNLSNPNGRAVRLRITCDSKYPYLISKIERSIKLIAPTNKVSRINRADSAVDISCYSNDWEKLLGWKAKGGSKINQKVCVPTWIFKNKEYTQACLTGLFETDGSVYKDRKYLTVNFVTEIPSLAKCVEKMIYSLGYIASIQKLVLPDNKSKTTFRIHRKAENFIKELNIQKK
ncbi:MAG: LAGLIDADG family homing endonuclease [Patescibacteria group bacterium]